MESVRNVFSNSEMVRDYARKVPLGHPSFLGPGEEEENDMERTITNMKDSGILLQMSLLPISKTADIQSSELPVCTIHFSADPSHADLLLRTINSANQLSIYGAIADWRDELTQQILGNLFSSMEKSIAKAN